MILQEMIVTNSEGKTETPEDGDLTGRCFEGEDVYTFYAVKKVNPSSSTPTAEQKAAKVKIMMPLGGDLNGMYRFPRVGEKVVVGVEGTAHYLMGYLPTKEKPFSPEKEKKDAFNKKAQILRYKKTGDNTSDSTYSEIGFYSEETEWKKKSDDETLPVVDKIKLSSTGDIETHAQNYNETAAKRIALFAGYGDDIEKRKAKQKQNLKDKKTDLDLEAFPVMPQDYADQDPTFLTGDIQMRAKNRIVLKAEDTIEIIAGHSLIRLDSSGITLLSRKASISSVNAWDTSLTLSANAGVTMFGTKVAINSAYKFALTDAFGGTVQSVGGVMRLSGADVGMMSMCKAAYLVKGVSASASFATNVASVSMGIDQERGNRTGDGSTVNKMASYFSIGAGVAGTVVGVNWNLNSASSLRADDTAGAIVGLTDFLITMLGLVNTILESVILSKTDKKNCGQSGLALALMIAEYGLIMQQFIRLEVANPSWVHMGNVLLKSGGNVYVSGTSIIETAVGGVNAKSPTAGADTWFLADLARMVFGKEAQGEFWKLALKSAAAAAVLIAGGGAGAYVGYCHSSSTNASIRKELEAL
ncbi:MAG: hypothetical protein J5787_05630 [Alphaproteobacteria bacterium]|nr:hypothetical protein [Alphaproteobacteria bacterium]